MSRGQTARNSAQAAPLEAFQVGLSTINALWRPWWTTVVGFAAAAYVIFRTWGGDGTFRERFWEVSRDAAILGGFMLVAVALSVWLGRRVQKQRAAR